MNGKEIKGASNLVIGPEHYRLHVINYNVEPANKHSCIALEHRGGICPHGHQHGSAEDIYGKNTVLNTLRKSLIYQMTGTASPTNLLITKVACGTSATATDPLAQTQAYSETYRDSPTDLIMTSDTTLSVFWYFNTTQANSVSALQEWVILGGGATNVAGSGVGLARFLQTFSKNSGTTVSGQYDFGC